VKQISASEAPVPGARADVPDHVVYREFAHETVILNLQTGRYHGVNATGGRILDLLASRATIGAAATRLAEESGQPLEEIERDVLAFCADLASRGLIELRLDDAA
jgi:Coenzyme PQQ synthesis protein D (PqqD)